MNPYEIIQRPRISEKSVYLQSAHNTYTFEVIKSANRVQVKEAVEALFDVKVVKVNTINCAGKKKRVGRSIGMTSDWKKAMVTLAEGQQIEGV